MPSSIHKILVCGAGTMGSGIAQSAIQSGFNVSLYDMDPRALGNADTVIHHSIQRHLDKGKLKEEEKKQILNRLTLCDNYRAVNANIVIEAIVEKMEAKLSLFKGLSSCFPEGTILATNTSSLSVTEMAKAVHEKKYVIGMHFFNPAPVMKLVEIVKTTYSSTETIEAAMTFVGQLNKTAVIVKDSPGFIVNRIARQYYLEAFRLAEDQMADFKTIDRLLENTGFSMGPFALTDLIGQDINYTTTQSLYQAFFQEARFRPSSLQAHLVKAGHLGKKSGRGFFEY